VGKPTSTVPDWAAIAQLYDRLASVERLRPGSPEAQDLEAAITLLIDGRVTSSASRHRLHDALRRARFLRVQADRKRGPANARLAARVEWSRPDGDAFDGHRSEAAEPVDPLGPEEVVVALETARWLARPCPAGAGRHAERVLAGLLRQDDAATTAASIGVSRSTVVRCIALLRSEMRDQLESAAA
jgi:hypothetical protein